ncbi:MAG TPA: excinuclease ABC subunit UvrC [Candidatus Anaerostipes excrementavium]|uniref:UvrABC system protein C n=1 Tax=Candidatus Anaerostipes excrementavium TaxID=2838463 RepID=A0A9D2B904_9FIRM|nr:excinuclease ABC subunit UvrC [uncultured Anaerostipes sp.]HIX67363.1 excinuclease ABC subunit UvrC [Candidatus Anaerostipes excrementavium]
MFDIQEELKKLPAKPGVYLMHNDKDEIIYVGKAIKLCNRVRQYFQDSRNLSVKIQHMVQNVAYFEYIITDSELEALVLESNLIKEHRPKYNTMLKDDKNYPYIKVTTNEDYPRIVLARKMKQDGCKYYGPYTSAGAVNDTIELLRKIFRIRTCARKLPRDIGKDRPCLYYQIKQCNAPCQGYISKEDYGKQIDQAIGFLNGNYKDVARDLKEKMEAASSQLEFEQAMEYRDLLKSIQKIMDRQKINTQGFEDRDMIAMAKDEKDAVVSIFFVRQGKLLGREHFHMELNEETQDGAILGAFVKQFYAGTPYLPSEIFLEYPIEDMDTIEKWLGKKRGGRVRLYVPVRGTKHRMIEMAKENAKNVLRMDRDKLKREEKRTIGAVHEIERLLGIRGLDRMEAFDISNISGFQTVASMVVFEKGKARRQDYRKFRLKTIEGPDDYASMEEVLTRRFLHGKKELEDLQKEGKDENLGSFTKFPNLILMDGGKGQVNVAERVLSRLNLQIPVCGMVKDDNHRTRGLYYHNEEILFPRNSEAFLLVTRIQDEAHRFAIEYHRSLRGKGQVHSVLDDIKGVGPKRRKALMRYFKDLSEIRKATPEELLKVPGMNRTTAEKIYSFFHSSQA